MQYHPDHAGEEGKAYKSITATPKKLWGKVPGKQLPLIVGRTHSSGLLKDAGQVVGWVPVVRLGRFYERV
jgi:hypothetical protein